MTYYFVIDTDEYAGNFERQTCAYVTGVVGECDVGDSIAAKARESIPQKMLDIFDEHIKSEPDRHGCYRPCKIYPTPGFYNNGLGFAFVDGEEEQAIEAYRQNCIDYGNKQFYAHIPEEQEKHCKRWYDKAANAENEYGHFPSYQSVAIAFYDEPDEDVIELMKSRAEEWAKICREGRAKEFGGSEFDSGFNILGFRVVQEWAESEEYPV